MELPFAADLPLVTILIVVAIIAIIVWIVLALSNRRSRY